MFNCNLIEVEITLSCDLAVVEYDYIDFTDRNDRRNNHHRRPGNFNNRKGHKKNRGKSFEEKITDNTITDVRINTVDSYAEHTAYRAFEISKTFMF